MATCSKCGKLNYEGVKYCTACGTPLTESGGYYNQDDNGDQDQDASEEESAPSGTQEERPEKKGFNKRILFIILGVVLLVGLIFLLRILFSSKEIQVEFTTTPETVYPNTEVTFTDKTVGAEEWDWDFGDGGNEEEIGQIVHHTYGTTGEYTVTLTVNGKYTASKIVYVVENPASKPVEEEMDVVIEGPMEVTVGEPAVFVDKTPGATEWQWQFGENGGVDATQNPATYTFNIPNANAQVRVSNNATKKIGIFNVVVKRKKQQQVTPTAPDNNKGGGGTPPAKPKEPVKPKLTSKQVEDIFKKYIGLSANFFDDMMKIANDIGCGDVTNMKIVNSNGTTKNLSEFMQNLKFLAKNTQITVGKLKQDNEGCVVSIDVTQK